MYIDGHKREDIVAYRREFVERWATYDKCFHKWDNDGHELPRPNGFPVTPRLYLCYMRFVSDIIFLLCVYYQPAFPLYTRLFRT